MWTLPEAVRFLRGLVVECRARGYHVALTGGVLVSGASSKDLDVIVYPMHKGGRQVHNAYRALRAFGMKRRWDRRFVTEQWRKAGSLDTKHVEVWRYGKLRVDVFFLS